MLAVLAQLVEQRTENPRVTGSSPVCGIGLKKRSIVGALFCLVE